MQTESFSIIFRRLVAYFLLGIGLVIGVVILLNKRQEQYVEQRSGVARLINVSGRQRMLSQNITKSLLVLEEGETTSSEIDSLVSLFSNSHDLLLNYMGFQKDEALSQSQIHVLFDEMQPYYEGIVEVTKRCIQDQKLSSEDRALILQYERQFLPLMDTIVKRYEVLEYARLSKVKDHVTVSNYIIAIAVMISASLVFIVTIIAIRSYSNSLQSFKARLTDALKVADIKVRKFEFLTKAIKVGIWEKSYEEESESWSDRMYEILDLKISDKKKSFDDFLDCVHPADKIKLKDASEISLHTGEPSTVEVRVMRAKGGYKWVEATGNIDRDPQTGKIKMMVGAIQDIHSRKVLEHQLKMFVENAPAAIAMFDTDMRYTAVSARWISDYGLQGKFVIGRSHYDMFPAIRDEWKEIHQECLKGVNKKCDEDYLVHADGTSQWIKWDIRPWYLSEDEVGGILMFTEDITKFKKQNEELKEAKEKAESASKAKQDFLTTMSHEIRTPLNAILGLTQILITEHPREDQVEYLDLLKFSGDNLLALVNDILDMSKIESGKLTLEHRPFDLYYLVKNIHSSLEFKKKDGVSLELNYEEGLHHFYYGDPMRLSQVVYNLAGNAIKFTEAGSVKIIVKDVTADSDEEKKILISVKDTGIGISHENQEKIFQSFEQAERGTSRQYGGTGLGLYVTRRLLNLMGTEIQLKSQSGIGSEFFFHISLSKCEQDLSYDREQNVLEVGERQIKIRVLIAEDNTANQFIIGKFFDKQGISYDIVENGEKVLAKVKNKVYDMIFMDLHMPLMDGLEASRAIRQMKEEDSYFEEIPIIALTADVFANFEHHIKAVGINDYINKPFKKSELMETVYNYAGMVIKSNMESERD